MIRTSVFIALMVVSFSAITLPQRAEAGFIIFGCYASVPIGGLAPNPTVGCVMRWFPGGPGVTAKYEAVFDCDPNCVVVPAIVESPSININLSAGSIWNQIERNCLGRIPSVEVVGLATSKKYAPGRIRSLVVDQEIPGANEGLVGLFCPGGSGMSLGGI